MPANEDPTMSTPSSAKGETRKTVTILFADIVASTELGERLDAEALRHVVSRYFTEMASVLERHGGTVEKFIGDEVMAVFGVPVVHEDDALRAVRSAAAMKERLLAINAELAETWGAHLEARIAVNTGEVVAGDPSPGHGFVTGEAVTLAKRIQQAAAPGDILIGQATFRLVRHAVETTPLDPFRVKGRRDELTAHKLEAVDHESEPFVRRLDAPLVGRAMELRLLEDAYRRAVEQRAPHLVTILGAAGIGKSRLARELLDLVEGDANILVGRCLPYGEGITFWPIREIIPDETFEGTSEEIFWRIRKRLEEQARERPLVVCFEDVHWGEATFLDLVQYLAGWIRDCAVLLVCVARPELLERRPDWADAARGAWALRLGPLSAADSRALVDRLDAPDRVRDQIAEIAEGNPLFVEQMAAMVADDDQADMTLPMSIRGLLAARLDRLDEDEAAIVDRASVIGRDFPLRAVVALAPDQLRTRVSALLLTLVRKGLVQPQRSADEDSFRFRHALIRDAAYESVPKHSRAELHGRHAEWLEESDAAPLLVGYHFEQAVLLRRELGLDDASTRSLALRAGQLLGAAGTRASRRGDLPAAVGLLTRAIALLEGEERLRLELASDLGVALRDMGEPAKAEPLLERTIADAARLGDPRVEARARIALSVIRMQVEPEGAADDVAKVAEDAIRVFSDAGDEDGLAQAWIHVSRMHLIHSRWGDATHALERALTHARSAGNRREEATILGQLALALYWGPANASDAIDRCRQMLAETGDDRTIEARVTVAMAGLEAMRGQFDVARALYWRSKETLVDLGLKPWLAAHTLAYASIEMLAGEPGAAEEELRFGVEALDELGLRSSFSTLASTLARVTFELGNWRDAEQLLERARVAAAVEDVASAVLWRTTAARILAAKGEVEAAERYSREAVALAGGTDALNLRADALVDHAAVLRFRTDDIGADAALDEAVRLYGLKGNTVSEARAADLRAGAMLDT
jgi:class 3 adenylate cyclase/tetratricopeptide (TPR) repeat protein